MMQATVDFTALYQHHHRIVWAFCYHLTSSPEDADDLSQEVWLRAWRAGIVPDNPHAWLCKIAHNLAIDRWRSCAKRARRVSVCSLESLAADDGIEDEKRRELAAYVIASPLDEGWDSVLVVWSQLTEEQAQAVALWADGWPAEEAGALSGRSAGAHKALRFRGVARLKQALGVAA
ncbi:MAG TPA: RNA polymerase sigma factor [Caldilineaceae bacterium]|nr:RNA polymerase sigma factor [Caldilineaceae bacterium]